MDFLKKKIETIRMIDDLPQLPQGSSFENEPNK